ncbi:hypothetical protein H5410_016887 [Solanum commersonii]|uniref:Uncharacterized protein n=1 Tax=Solanum commersonii TaxID=4109 RepID=A0A9J5ZYZ1_SOLCO|nr:hypothetical protein H5410_016887 [Solanum commersonii]
MSIVLIAGCLKDPVTAVASLSICVRVSNELGLGHARATKYSVYVTLFQSLLIGILCMSVVLALRELYSSIVLSPQNDLFVLLLEGLWGGMIAGLALQTLLLSIVIYRIDWDKEVEQTTKRMRLWGDQDIEK